MTNYWGYIAAIGTALTALTIAPFVFELAGLTLNTSMQSVGPATIEKAVRLMVAALLAIVPLSVGGMILFTIFQFAEEMA